ncbi:hypothetical protein [Mycobacteroides abscessus]|uniref:hypothetical protein n=1 Tax=Mycobacteroides abscessus TaxID=36809 RepID=UPI001054EBCD|nr:hypothetical protein [Mycobacteroides abscessus]
MPTPSPQTITRHEAPTAVGPNDSWTGPVFSVICGRISGQVNRTLDHDTDAVTTGHNAVIEGFGELQWVDDPQSLADLSVVAAILATELDRAAEAEE